VRGTPGNRRSYRDNRYFSGHSYFFASETVPDTFSLLNHPEQWKQFTTTDNRKIPEWPEKTS